MRLATLFCKRAAFCFALIFTAYPSLTQQELAAGSRRVSALQEDARDGPMLSALFQQGIPTSEGFRHSPAGSAGNVTIENLSDSLTRLEDNLSSLIQSFLTVQRSVFNLEQLQELLVLLLEDILKQTGKSDKIPVKDTTIRPGGAYAGGSDAGGSDAGGSDAGGSDAGGSDAGDASLIKGSHDSDSSGSKSAENGDGDDESDVVASPDVNDNIGEVNGRNNGRVTGNEVLARGQSPATHESMFGLNKDHAVASSRHETDTSQQDGKDDSGGDSSEGRNSNSNENYSGQRTAIQRSTQPADVPLSSSQKPQWSEPMMERTSSNTHPRFYDVVNRIASRLGQSFIRKPSPRLHGLMQMISSPHVKQSESTFERPSMVQPLEILAAHESSMKTTEEKHLTNMFPLKVKLRQESVISHGGPLTGPEQFSSMFMEHPEDYTGIESTGERSTGMINNLVLSNGSLSPIPVQPDEPTFHSASSAQSVDQDSVPDIRRKRQVRKYIKVKNSSAENSSPVATSSAVNGSEGTNESLIFKATTSQLNVTILNTPERSTESGANITKYPLKNYTNGSAFSNFSRALIHDTPKQLHNTESSSVAQEYDVLIASLLKDLSSKLQQHHLGPDQHDATTDELISQVDSELNKLIWIPSEDIASGQATIKIKTEATNKKTTGYESSIMSPRIADTTLQTFLIKTKQAGEDFSETLQNSRKTNLLTTMATEISKVHERSQSGDTYARSLPKEAVFQETVSFKETSDILSTVTPNTDVFVTETVVTAQDGYWQQNVTNSTYTEWEWLHKLIDSNEFPTVDWGWLTETLTLLSHNESIAGDLKELNDKGRALLERKSLSGGLRSNVNTETQREMSILTHNIDNDISGDTKLVSPGDSSESSDEDRDKNNEKLTKVGRTDSHSPFKDSFKLDSGVNSVQYSTNANTDKRDTDSSEDNDIWNRSSESNEDNGRNVDISVEGQDKNGAVVQENGDTLINADYIIHKSTPRPHTTSQMQDPPSGLFDKMLAHHGQMIHRRLELPKRHQRSTDGIINDAITILNISQEDGRDKSSFNRQKRQAGPSGNRPNHDHTKSSTVDQPTNDYTQRQDGNGSLNSSQKESINVSDQHRNTTQNKETIFQNSPQSSLNQGSHKNEITPTQSDLNFPFIGPHSSESRKQPQPDGAISHDVTQTNPQLDHPRSSDLQSFQFPLNGFPNPLDHRTNNNPHIEHPGPSSPEPGETPSVEEPSVMDLEEILSMLFMSYWQRFYNLYTRSAPQTTPPADWDGEEEVTASTLTPTDLPELITGNIELDANFTSADPDTTGLSSKKVTTGDNIGGQL